MGKIIAYGLNEEGLKKQLRDEFSETYIEYEERYHGEYLGEFNGIEFNQEQNITEGAKRFEYLHLHNDYGLKAHIPRRFTKDIIEKIKKYHIKTYGETNQISMF